jgi:hypothetical protein
MLGSMHYNWRADQDNWAHPTCGGPQGTTYYDVGKSLIPEVIVLEGEPTGFPRAPLSKRRVYFDARNIEYPQAISYDRRGELWKTFEPGFSQYAYNDNSIRNASGKQVLATDGRPEWSWNWVISNDLQSKRVTRFYQGEKVQGGWSSGYDRESASDFISNYMTKSAMRRLGT